MSFVAGHYTSTYNAQSLGQMQRGFKTSHQVFKELITGDNMAKAPQCAVFQGMEMFIAMTLLEYNAAAAKAAFWPYGTYLSFGVVGRLDATAGPGGAGGPLVLPLVLTSVAGTPAAATPASLTFALSILQENFPVDLLYAPENRVVPLRMRIYPNTSRVFGVET